MSPFATLASTITRPAEGLAAAAQERRFVLPLLFATLAAIAFLIAAAPRIDIDRTAAEQIDRRAAAAGDSMTPHEREEAIARTHKLGLVAMSANAAIGPSLAALCVAFAAWLGCKVAGGRPLFVPAFAVAAHAQLPHALRQLLSIPAILRRDRVLPAELDRLLPSNLGALLPDGATGPTMALLSAIDLFAFASLAMLVLGMGHVAGVSRPRAIVVLATLWISYVAVFKVALPQLASPPGR